MFKGHFLLQNVLFIAEWILRGIQFGGVIFTDHLKTEKRLRIC